MQVAKVRAVQRNATWERCEDAVQSLRTPCGGVYFEHDQNKRHGLAFAQRVRQRAVGKIKIDHYVRKIWLLKI